jgi:hypothetical protein
MHLDNLSRGAAQSRGPARRITEGHDCRAKRRRCGENRRGATFLKGCCRAATQRSVTLTKCELSGKGVKLRRTQYEHMFSALLSNSDIARCIRHVSNVPHPDIPLNQWRGACFDSLSASRRTVFANVTPCTKPAANDDHRPDRHFSPRTQCQIAVAFVRIAMTGRQSSDC